MGNLPNLRLSFLLITCIPWLVVGQDICVKKGPCTCAFSNGTGIDLTPIAKGVFVSADIFAKKLEGKQYELSTYYYHPCYDALPPAGPSGPSDTCNKNLSICRHVYTLTQNSTTMYQIDSGVAEYMGNTNDSSFTPNGGSIVYDNPPSKTIVQLVCAETDDELHITSLTEPNNIVLSLYSRYACVRALNLPDEGGRSLGSTLLIIFLSFAIFYLVLGICTKKFLMGATGIEVIPNLAFWTDLPNLVKDGWAFAIAGFKLPVRGSGPALSPDQNSYDSI